MTWFRVDDNLAFHAKAVAAGNAAMGLWVRAGSWSSQQLSDGFIPNHIATTIGTRAEARKLVLVGLWIEDEAGYHFHQWEGRQPTREAVESERDAARERQRRARDKARLSRRDDYVTDTVTFPVVTVPPTRPDPKSKSKPSSATADAHFAEFWNQYPRKVGKQDAERVFHRQRKKHPVEAIISGCKRYAAHPGLPELEFIPHPATWLQRGGWEDELDARRPAADPTWQLPDPPDGITEGTEEYFTWARSVTEQHRVGLG